MRWMLWWGEHIAFKNGAETQFCIFDNQWKEGSTTSYMIHGVYKNQPVAGIKMLQTSDKEKNFKSTSKKWHSMYRRKIRKTSDFSSDTRSRKTVEIFKSTQEKKFNLESYTQKKYLSKTKVK